MTDKQQITKRKNILILEIPTYKTCKIRQDLINDGLSVPIGKHYYGGGKKLFYKWVGDDKFHVYFKNKWRNAQSIDFDFTS